VRGPLASPFVTTVDAPTTPALTSVPAWSPADRRMRRLLRLPQDAPRATEASARQLVEKSLVISMARCLLTYIVLPFVVPIIGIAGDIAPVVGIVLGGVAIVANVASVRRFWRADHRYRWHYTALAAVIIVAMVWLIAIDLSTILSYEPSRRRRDRSTVRTRV
jgi:hypothetical protein